MITVYHTTPRKPEFRSMMFSPSVEDGQRVLRGEDPELTYVKVAEVNTDDLEHAYTLTNTFDRYWWTNLDVKAFKGPRRGLRSTSVGDMMEQDGKKWLVAPCGFELIEGEQS